MRTLLIYPYSKVSPLGCNPPLALMYLASALISHDHEVAIADIDAFGGNLNSLVKFIKDYNPGLSGVPLYSCNLMEAYGFMRLLKKAVPDSLIVLGGPHATVESDYVLNNLPECDFIVRGEGEKTIVELVQSLEGKIRLEDILGLSFRINGGIVHNKERAEIPDLDGIAFPARHLLREAYKKGVYWRIEHKGVTDIVITSRGCSFGCKFCFKLFKNCRIRSPYGIMEEIISAKKAGANAIHFVDDTFTLDYNSCLQVLELIKKEKISMEFKVRSRPDKIDRSLLVLMREAGVKAVVYGFETGSQKILDSMAKGNSIQKNLEVGMLTREVGLQVYADMLLGYPSETPDTVKETMSFLSRLKPDGVNLSVLLPFPGTEVYRQAKMSGALIGDWSFKNGAPWVKLDWTNTYAELLEAYRKIQRSFWLDPCVIMRSLLFLFVLRPSFSHLRRAVKFFLKMVFNPSPKKMFSNFKLRKDG